MVQAPRAETIGRAIDVTLGNLIFVCCSIEAELKLILSQNNVFLGNEAIARSSAICNVKRNLIPTTRYVLADVLARGLQSQVEFL